MNLEHILLITYTILGFFFIAKVCMEIATLKRRWRKDDEKHEAQIESLKKALNSQIKNDKKLADAKAAMYKANIPKRKPWEGDEE